MKLSVFLFATITLLQFTKVNTLGSSSTIAVTSATSTICGILAVDSTHSIQCYQNGQTIPIRPNISFQAISGGYSFFCGLTSGGFNVFCWDTLPAQNSSFQPRRVYHSSRIPVTDLTVGDDQACAREVNSGIAICWRGSDFPSPGVAFSFNTVTSGIGFTCGILRSNSSVHCWGSSILALQIQRQFANLTMLNLVAGASHACGLTQNGFLVCKGNNDSGQLDVPFRSAFEFSGLALGSQFSCAIKQINGLVTCWGGGVHEFLQNSPFELIVAGLDFTCGLTTTNLSIVCSGSGWSNVLDQAKIIPGPCLESSCSTCGIYPGSQILCGGSGNICKSCQIDLPIAVPLTPRAAKPPFYPARAINKLSLAFLIVGSVGSFAGICCIVYILRVVLRRRHQNLVQPTIINAAAVTNNTSSAATTSTTTTSLRSFSARLHSSQRLSRQRSESSSKHAEKIQNFSLSELVFATNNFSLQNKIGSGSFGSVYKGKLGDGRQVAIKRGETIYKGKKFQEKESAFDSELALLSRLHHKHLVDLIGYCEEGEERLLVYEYMSNGALHDHLHNKNNIEKSSSILNSWRLRIKIALDAARGIDYLHNYAVPPIIHRDIKSSNILLDADFTAKVSDFGLSLMGPDSDQEFMSTKAVGTVGYIDPEYYVLNVLTAKSDVYGLGVVLLELLTGKRAVFKTEEGAMGIVDWARPFVSEGELKKLLDRRVGWPEIHEIEAVELVAYTAMCCVKLEGKERPNIVDIVANLERALAMCEDR